MENKKKVEVKNWETPVHSGIIRDAAKKGVKEIVAKNDFTAPAKKLAKQKGIKLKKGK